MCRLVLWLKGMFYMDARLAAAAPDLLEALVQCQSVLRTLRGETDSKVAKQVIDRKMDLAWKAIDKAGGPAKNR